MELEALENNWEGRGSPAPSSSLLSSAREVLAILQAGALARGYPWENPHIGSNEHGHITLEWWHGSRTLTVFIRTEERVDYLKSWGSNIESEMEDGELSRINDFAAISRWPYQPDALAA